MWSQPGWAPLKTLSGHEQKISCVDVSPGKSTLDVLLDRPPPQGAEGNRGGKYAFSTVRWGRASFGGDVYNVRKWRRNLRTKMRKCLQTKISRETNNALRKYLYHRARKTMQRNKMFLARFRFRILACLVCLRRVETAPFLLAPYASLPWFCVQLDLYA